MALNIKNAEAERLAGELADLLGETKTEAVRRALEERRARVRRRLGDVEARRERLRRFLEREVWARVPPGQVGSMPDRAEREAILGYGDAGV